MASFKSQTAKYRMASATYKREKTIESNNLKCVSTAVMGWGWGGRLGVESDYPVLSFSCFPQLPPCLAVAALQI